MSVFSLEGGVTLMMVTDSLSFDFLDTSTLSSSLLAIATVLGASVLDSEIFEVSETSVAIFSERRGFNFT